MCEEIKYKKFFYFLQNFLLRGVSVVAVLLIFLGGAGLLFAKQNKIIYFVLCLIGYVLITLSSYALIGTMNKKEKSLPLQALKALRSKKF